MIYFDNAATTHPKPPEVYAAADDCLRNWAANPGRGGHKMAVEANRIVFDARDKIGELLGIPDPDRIVFSQNATSAINTALFGVLEPGDHCITSNLEHNAVVRPLCALADRGVAVSRFEVSAEGEVDWNAFEALFQPNTKLLVFTHVSNVSGTILPVQKLTEIARGKGVAVLLDASQSAGAMPLNVAALGLDFLACPGHKGLLGPQGTGLLYISRRFDIEPFVFGGTGSKSEEERMPEFLPDRFEAGTVNTPGLAGLAAGADFLLRTGVAAVHAREAQLCKRLLAGMDGIQGLTIHGPRSASRAPVVSFTFAHLDPASLGDALDSEFDIACRVGLHCAPDAHRMLGTFPTGTVRVAPGYFNTDTEIDALVSALECLSKRAP
jgi:cysteine desulfurase / selenocysteine lyase